MCIVIQLQYIHTLHNYRQDETRVRVSVGGSVAGLGNLTEAVKFRAPKACSGMDTVEGEPIALFGANLS